jgi:hypothetical protein
MELKPEQRDPTLQDLQDIKIRAGGLSGGDIVHERDNCLGVLDAVIKLADEKGWNEKYLKIWNEKVGSINILILKKRIEQAREKDLL